MKELNITIFCLHGLSLSDTVQIGLFIVGFLTVLIAGYTARVLYKTLLEGQRQSRESQKQTGYSLAINQYNIFYQDLNGIIDRFKEMNFNEILKKNNVNENQFPLNFRNSLKEATGLNVPMIGLFNLFTIPDKSTRNKTQESSFRFYILFPLLRQYTNLLDFLNEVKKDDLLGERYKQKIYKIVERDVLQCYFRICNYSAGTDLGYDLTCFYPNDLKIFYAINNFYIEEQAFQYHDLDFYKNTN